MSINERINSVLSTIEFQLARSLPIFNNGNEIIFFYKISEISDIEYIVNEIRYIVFRNIDNNEIEVLKANDVIPDSILNAVINTTNQHTLSVQQELEAEDKYLDLYEDLLKHKQVTSMDISDRKKLLSLFSTLVDSTSLKELYLYLGENFFEILSL